MHISTLSLFHVVLNYKNISIDSILYFQKGRDLIRSSNHTQI